jgi:hypothetical protein
VYELRAQLDRQREPGDMPGVDPATDPGAGFQHRDAKVGVVQCARRGESGNAGPDHYDIGDDVGGWRRTGRRCYADLISVHN